jgi:hypothetical protein
MTCQNLLLHLYAATGRLPSDEMLMRILLLGFRVRSTPYALSPPRPPHSTQLFSLSAALRALAPPPVRPRLPPSLILSLRLATPPTLSCISTPLRAPPVRRDAFRDIGSHNTMMKAYAAAAAAVAASMQLATCSTECS